MSSKVCDFAARRELLSMPPTASSVMNKIIWMAEIKRRTDKIESFGQRLIFSDSKKFSFLAF